MFGPNKVYKPITPDIFDHRSVDALALSNNVKSMLRNTFALQDYEILFIPGPATVAMQAVITSCIPHVIVTGTGKFDQRWREMARGRQRPDSGGHPVTLYCLLETSESRHSPSYLATSDCIVDAVSGFPYYRIPANAIAWVTTSCKQLGAPAGLSIVGVKSDRWSMFAESGSFSFLDLWRHRGNHFLTTAPMNVLEHLEANLSQIDYFESQQEQINRVSCELAVRLDNHPGCSIGDRIGPVVTVRAEEFDLWYPGVAEKFGLYPEARPGDRYHIFTYSEPESAYDELLEAMDDAG